MRVIARYIGKTEKLGVKPGEIHPIELNTYPTGNETPLLWVRAEDCDEYLMPFVSVNAMLRAWEPIEDEDTAERDQNMLEDEWLETYYPGAAVL